jgi:hypothetical protein
VHRPRSRGVTPHDQPQSEGFGVFMVFSKHV